MIGHAFLHGGPRLAGVSQAMVHVLLGGSAETATVQIEDCPDHDIRETIKLVSTTKENRKWLFERLLSHAVLFFYCLSFKF